MTPPTLSFRGGRLPDAVPVSLDRLIESKLLVQANSGGGKSWAVRYLLEQTHGKVQHIVLDREGEFATLREKYPYLLMGRDGDYATDARSAKLLARKLLELGLSAVIDLSDMSLGGQREYVQVFVDAINHLPRQLWKDCLIVIDEAHLFAPEKGKGSSAASEAIALLLSTGRKRGYCVVLATQRIAKLDKDVAAECLNKLIGRTSQEDVARAGDELAMSKEAARALRALEPGTFWAYGPAIASDPVLVRTGAVTTHPPKRGTAREPAPVAPATIKKVMAELADLPKQAADEERTLAELQRDLRDARAALARAEKTGTQKVVEKPIADPRAIERAVAETKRSLGAKMAQLRKALEAAMKFLVTINTQNFDVAGVDKAELERAITAAVGKATQIIDGRLEARARQVEKIREEAKRLLTTLQAIADEQDVVVSVDVAKNEPFTVTTAKRSEGGTRSAGSHRPARERVEPAEGLSAPQQRILNTLATFKALGSYPVARSNVAAFSEASPTSSSYANNLGRLRTLGYIDYPIDGFVALTDTGEPLAIATEIPDRATLRASWLALLSGPQGRIITALCDVHPGGIEREALAALVEASATSSSFANNLGALRSLGLIDYRKVGGSTGGTEVYATDLLYPEGLD